MGRQSCQSSLLLFDAGDDIVGERTVDIILGQVGEEPVHARTAYQFVVTAVGVDRVGVEPAGAKRERVPSILHRSW
jgi:hypothetical protein